VDRAGSAHRAALRGVTTGAATATRPRWLRALARTLTVLVAGVALALIIDIARVGGPQAWLAARAPAFTAPLAYDALGRQVDVGGGRSVYLDCRGTGSPTVILEAGAGGGAAGWGPFFDRVAALSRTCAWDRPGLGRSAPRGLHTGGQTAEDLRAALRTAGEHGPYIVVAHSLGGMYARLFAQAEPAVRGLLMLDVYVPDLGMDTDPALSPEIRAQIRTALDEGGVAFQQSEQLDYAATVAELVRPVPVPVIALYVDQRQRFADPDPAVSSAMIAAWYRGMDAQYGAGRVEIVDDTSHFIQFDRPDLVLNRLGTLLAAVRGG
jgi:pimeloyl-ACP methyl ester carboxylesterase